MCTGHGELNKIKKRKKKPYLFILFNDALVWTSITSFKFKGKKRERAQPVTATTRVTRHVYHLYFLTVFACHLDVLHLADARVENVANEPLQLSISNKSKKDSRCVCLAGSHP